MTQTIENSDGRALAEGRDGLLWRLARLHPGLVTLIVWLGFFVVPGFGEAVWENSSVAAVLSIGVYFIYLGYPCFVLFFVAGRFRSRSPRRTGRILAAVTAMSAFCISVLVVDHERYSAFLEAGSVLAIVIHLTILLVLFLAIFYPLIGAAVALAGAEMGPTASFRRKFGTSLQFFYLPFCVFFLHRRIRRLVSDFENGDPMVVNLPLEVLKIERQASGHLSLLLTEQVGWEDHERYADELLRRLDSHIGEKGYLAGMYLWKVEIETVPLQLVYEDSLNRVMLKSDSYPGDVLLKKLQPQLALAA